jgi:pyruvate,water dikinase
VVTELGGVVSHAAIVARENGLPAIVSVPGVTLTVRSGQRLRVDSTAGTVEILG